ncbi:MAG: hypothetical protein L6408_01475 [Nanoarchaeota archaeon]|nr:hypothetical protein [Nanoarchaeota archaeon]
MYALYDQVKESSTLKLKFKKEISLAGSQSGLIPTALKSILTKNQSAPFGWHLSIPEIYIETNQFVIIDIRPNNKKYKNIFICELTDVFGYSYLKWTPILFRLKGLYVDIPPSSIDKNFFEYPANPELIYTMLYLSGSVSEGKLVGTWNYPGPSPTNSVLLWPEALSYFIKSIKSKDPDFIE